MIEIFTSSEENDRELAKIINTYLKDASIRYAILIMPDDDES